MHPMALPNSSGFTDGNDVSVKSGDRVQYRFGLRTGVLDEALQDGDAFVTWDDGTYGTVKWHHLAAIPIRGAYP